MPAPLVYQSNNKSPQKRKQFVQNMFDSLVPTYDLLNQILSLGSHRKWHRDMVDRIGRVKGSMVLDLCCGTGDISKVLNDRGAKTVSLDFSREMLRRGLHKGALGIGANIMGDASVLPFKSDCFDAVTIAFGIRNLPDLDSFMMEVCRVLRPGGKLIILELVRPEKKLTRAFYSLYLKKLLPIIGGIISGRPLAYKYLAGTISTFVHPLTIRKMLKECGFASVANYPKTFGVATVMVCAKGGV